MTTRLCTKTTYPWSTTARRATRMRATRAARAAAWVLRGPSARSLARATQKRRRRCSRCGRRRSSASTTPPTASRSSSGLRRPTRRARRCCAARRRSGASTTCAATRICSRRARRRLWPSSSCPRARRCVICMRPASCKAAARPARIPSGSRMTRWRSWRRRAPRACTTRSRTCASAPASCRWTSCSTRASTWPWAATVPPPVTGRTFWRPSSWRRRCRACSRPSTAAGPPRAAPRLRSPPRTATRRSAWEARPARSSRAPAPT
mmetsp:Transcript_11191/g.24040  ORF Transcript_11191/g.24040 Transcript_11191/m.24040 type:complete len:264 (+) Transcript_11191:750-1541(+)